MSEFSDLAVEIGEVLTTETDEALSVEELVDVTSGESEEAVKRALGELMEAGCITSTPGFTYRLSRSSLSERFQE